MQEAHNQQGSSSIIAVVLIIIIIGAGAWFLIARRDDKITQSNTTPVAQTENTNTQQNGQGFMSQDILEKAKYIYEQTPLESSNRYDELSSKGYVTADFAEKAKGEEIDQLLCSQRAAESYTYGEVNGSNDEATLVVTANYSEGTKKLDIPTTWIKQEARWKINATTCPDVF